MPLFDLYSRGRGGYLESETEFLQGSHSQSQSPLLNSGEGGRNRRNRGRRNPRFPFYNHSQNNSPDPFSYQNSNPGSNQGQSQNQFQYHNYDYTSSTRSSPIPSLRNIPQLQLPGIPLQIPIPISPGSLSHNSSPRHGRSSSSSTSRIRGNVRQAPYSSHPPLPLPVPIPVQVQGQNQPPVQVSRPSNTMDDPPTLPLLPPFGDWNFIQNPIPVHSQSQSQASNMKPSLNINLNPNSNSNPSANSNLNSNLKSSNTASLNPPANLNLNLGVAFNSSSSTQNANAQTSSFLTSTGGGGGPNFNFQTTMPLNLIRNRRIAQLTSVIDAIFATGMLVFHGLTLMVQEMPEKSTAIDNNWLLPKVPMTPGELNITGYMEVIAWIAILSVNAIQLLVAISLFNASDKKRESLKAFEASRVWLKTCVFLLIILLIKLCILYFMYEMNMRAPGTIVWTFLETLFHIFGLFVVFKFFDEIKKNNPMLHSNDEDEDEANLDDDSPSKRAAADAVWF